MIKIFLFGCALFTSLLSMAQNNRDITGEWKVFYDSENVNEFSFQRTQPDTNNFRDWGRFFEFSEDGTYSEYASAPCGLDDNHYRYTGKWSFDIKTGIIDLKEIKVNNDRPNIYRIYKVLPSGKLKVLSFNKKEFKVKVVKAWEETTEKKF